MAVLAAKYAYCIIKNHPFIDGNKRTALIVIHVFLRLNKLQLNATEEKQYVNIIGGASGILTEQAFTSWLAENTTEFF
jgi:death-on-curing protein